MKLIRFGAINDEKPGVITSDGARRDISAFGRPVEGDGNPRTPRFPCI